MKVIAWAGLVALCGASALGSDWPCYRGPRGDGVVADAGLLEAWTASGPALVWSVPLTDDGDGSHAGPAVSQDRVYIPVRTGRQDVLICLDSSTGTEVWRYAWTVLDREAKCGDGVIATPTVYRNRVYVLGCYGLLLCLDADGGALLWQRDLVADFGGTCPPFGMSSAPLMVDDMLVCQPGGKGASLVALDPATGKEIWRSGDDESSYATPLLVELRGVRQILAYPASGLVAHDVKTGKELWRYAYVAGREKNIPEPLFGDDRVYCSNNTLGFSALDVVNNAGNWSVSRRWSARDEKMNYSSPVLGEGCLYFHSSKREIKCLALKDGGECWASRGMGEQDGMLLRLENHRLLSVNDNGQAVLLEVSAQQVQERGRFQACGKAYPQPAVADGRLYVRDHQTVFCYDLRNAGTESASPVTQASEEWRDRWPLLANCFFVGWLTSVALAVLGVLLLRRGQADVPLLAVEWASVGVAAAMLLGGLFAATDQMFRSRGFFDLMSVAGAFVAVCGCRLGVAAGPAWKSWRTWNLFLSGAGALLVLHSLPVADIDVPQLLASTVIRNTHSTVGFWLFCTPLTLAFAGLALWQASRLDRAGETLRKGWLMVAGLAVAAIVGVAVNSVGTLLTAAMLFLPAIAARRLTVRARWQFPLATALGLFAITTGFVLAEVFRTSPAKTATALFLMTALLSCGVKWVLRRKRQVSFVAGQDGAVLAGGERPAGSP